LNGLNPSEIETRETELVIDLNGLKMAILVIANLCVEGFVNCVSTLGPGYRVYFGQIDNRLMLLLCGGDKTSQQRDIEFAKSCLIEYKETRQ